MKLRYWGVLLTFPLLSNTYSNNDTKSPTDESIVAHAVAKASQLTRQQSWDPFAKEECPLDVGDAVSIAISALREDFPTVPVEETYISCKLSVTQTPEITQDMRVRMVLLHPCFWQVEFLLPHAIDTVEPKLDIRYIVLFDKTVVRPIRVTAPQKK